MRALIAAVAAIHTGPTVTTSAATLARRDVYSLGPHQCSAVDMRPIMIATTMTKAPKPAVTMVIPTATTSGSTHAASIQL